MNRYLMFLIGLAPILLLCACATNTLPSAAETGNSARIHAMLYEGVAVDQRGGFMNETALMIAARHGNLGIVRTLLEAGADINARSKYGDTALTAATHVCHSPVVEFLVNHDADANVKNYGYGSTPLMLAAECNDVTSVRALIKRDANINETNKKGMTALTAASAKGKTAVVQVLLDAGANPEEAYEEGETALFVAAHQGHDAIVKLLMEKGADINTRSRHTGWTPLMIAVEKGHSTTASILLESGATVNLTNDHGLTALMLAAWYGNEDIVALLLKRGADPNIVPNDNEGLTALIAATKKGYREEAYPIDSSYPRS